MSGIKLHGKIRVSTEDMVLSDVENTVTGLFEDMVAAGTIDRFFVGSHPVELGRTFIALNAPTPGSVTNWYTYPQYIFTVYLLNLTEAERNALTKTSHILPVYDGSFEIDDSKVVGYANAYIAASATKKGYTEPLENDFLINYRRHGLMFKWDADVISGTYNAIAVGMNVMDNRFAGAALFMGLESANQAIGEAEPSGYILRPGVQNADGSLILTADNEILLGDTLSTKTARKVLNLQTGVITLLDSSDPRYDFPLYDARYAQLVYGDYLIYNTGSELYSVDINTKTSTRIYSGYGGFIYDGYLYLRYNTTVFRAYNLSTFSYTSSKNLTIANMNFPAEFLEDDLDLNVTNLGDNYLVTYQASYSAGTVDGYSGKATAILCSDITDVAGSIIEFFPNINTSLGVIIGSEYYFFNNVVPSALDYELSFTYPNAGGSSVSIDLIGAKMCKSGMYGNLFSFHTYEEDQTIPTGQALKLEYYYTFEQ